MLAEDHLTKSDNVNAGAAPLDARGFPILMYHHVSHAPPRGTKSRYMFVSPSRFRSQMRALKLLGYVGCSMADLGDYLTGRKKGRAVGITFDDGYRNVFTDALPVLEEFGFTSTTYFVSGQIDGFNAWNVGRMPHAPCMSRSELRQWADRGQEVGAHTVDHARLGTLEEGEARRQIADSKRQLEDMTGRAVSAFSYPFGSLNDRVVEVVRESGFASATTTVSARATGSEDPMRLPRFTVRRTDWLPGFFWKRIL